MTPTYRSEMIAAAFAALESAQPTMRPTADEIAFQMARDEAHNARERSDVAPRFGEQFVFPGFENVR